jgi:hypothetical protein
MVIGGYRTAQILEEDPTAIARSREAFWILQMYFEMSVFLCFLLLHGVKAEWRISVAYSTLIAISLPEWFPESPPDEQHDSPPVIRQRRGSSIRPVQSAMAMKLEHKFTG